MIPRNIELLITQSRRATENEEFNDTTGLGDEEFLQYFNDGQDSIQTIIMNLFPDVFQEEKLISTVNGQEAYDIPTDAFLGNRVDMVEFSSTGQQDDFYTLKKGSKRERVSGVISTPAYYIRRSDQVLLQPQPSSPGGTLRILYQRRRPRLDKRRGQVSAVTLGSNTITTLTLDSTLNIDSTELLEECKITVVDKFGNQKMRSIQIDDVSESTGVVTVNSGFTFESGETIAVGDYVLRGEDSTTHPHLPKICEKHLIEYCNTRVLMRDSSNDAREVATLLNKIEEEIRTAFERPEGDYHLIPILDSQYLEAEDI